MSDLPKHSRTTLFLTAVQFLTRVPVSGAMSSSIEDYSSALKASVVFFPAVGVLIGFATTTIFLLACLGWPAWIAAILALSVEAWLTGAFHEDAFADATDALGGGWSREQVLEILKDSRHGTYGVLALVLGVSLRAALISQCEAMVACLAIPLSAGLGRWASLLMMHRLEPILDRHTLARDVGSKPCMRIVVQGFAWPSVTFAAIWALFYMIFPDAKSQSILIGSSLGLVLSIVSALAVSWYYTNLVYRRVGGVTGD